MRRAHCRGGFTVLRHVLRVLNLISQYRKASALRAQSFSFSRLFHTTKKRKRNLKSAGCRVPGKPHPEPKNDYL